MFGKIYFGLPLWVWLVIFGLVIYYLYQNNCAENSEKFSETSSAKIKVLNFNTNWCGWSKRFQPEWDEFSKRCKEKPELANIEAVDVKCDDSQYEEMCKNPKYDVPGFPYVVFEVNDKAVPYEGDRTADALEAAVKKLL